MSSLLPTHPESFCNATGLEPQTVTGWVGSYVFRDMLHEDQHDALPHKLYIVLELLPNSRSKPKKKGKVSCKHSSVVNIVNVGWVCFPKNRALIPKYLTSTSDDGNFQTVGYNNFWTSNLTNDLFRKNKYPGRDKTQWIEVILSDLTRTKWGPCKLSIPISISYLLFFVQ
jgi:hypothetical protein